MSTKAKDATTSVDENKEKALKAALAQIEKSFGKNTIMYLGDESAKIDVDVVSTGSLGLDIALGIGGLPKGRIIEIFGPESSGKTTLPTDHRRMPKARRHLCIH